MRFKFRFILAGIITGCLLGGAVLFVQAENTEEKPVVIASKVFTEAIILGSIIEQLIEAQGIEANHRKQLGGTQVLWKALIRGDIDVYPEYTGTLEKEILRNIPSSAIPKRLEELGLKMMPPLGFNNTYALAMKKKQSKKLGITKISDLKKHPGLTFGFSNEFMDRGDGWPGLKAHYQLPQTNVQGLNHDLAYRGLESGSIDLIDAYSTDAEIAYYDLVTLEDDIQFFPKYEGIILYRADLEERYPQAVKALRDLSGKISEDKMIALNHAVKIKRQLNDHVASIFVKETFQVETMLKTKTVAQSIWEWTKQHLFLVSVSLSAAIIISIPLGICAAFFKPVAGPILTIVGIIQTIPSLALLVFMIPLLGIGGPPAIMALFLYSLLPIVRNTYIGLKGISERLKESAEALGLSTMYTLTRIELPLAAPTILAGIKTSAVINIGTATLGALIGAGGYGQPILTGIRLADTSLILQGAIPAAVLALVAQGFFALCERWVVPKGLRLKKA